MTYEPQKDDLEDILNALQHEQIAVREQASQRLLVYVNSESKEAQNHTLTMAQALNAWAQACKERLQDRRILDALLLAIEDPSARVRGKAALMLRDATIPEAQEALIRHLRTDPVNQVRMMCVWGLDGAPNTLLKTEGFIAALSDPHFQVVFPACQSLGKLGDPQAIEPLRTVLSHTSWIVRFRACEALVRLKAVDLHVVNLLEELNQQPEAQQHNEMVQKINERNADLGLETSDTEGTETKAQTTQAVLDRARRLLSP